MSKHTTAAQRRARIEAGTWPACKVDGCTRPKRVQGMCDMHRNRMRRHGTVEAGRQYREPWQPRLLASYEVDKAGCWIWQAGINPRTGYGYIASYELSTTSTVPAHRASYILHHGPIPAGLYVCHTCDVRTCINPEHLWLGSAQDNMDDMTRKGRQVGGPNQPGRRKIVPKSR